jgi:hypothetical protein
VLAYVESREGIRCAAVVFGHELETHVEEFAAGEARGVAEGGG